jgi:hypothetical protein
MFRIRLLLGDKLGSNVAYSSRLGFLRAKTPAPGLVPDRQTRGLLCGTLTTPAALGALSSAQRLLLAVSPPPLLRGNCRMSNFAQIFAH